MSPVCAPPPVVFSPSSRRKEVDHSALLLLLSIAVCLLAVAVVSAIAFKVLSATEGGTASPSPASTVEARSLGVQRTVNSLREEIQRRREKRARLEQTQATSPQSDRDSAPSLVDLLGSVDPTKRH